MKLQTNKAPSLHSLQLARGLIWCRGRFYVIKHIFFILKKSDISKIFCIFAPTKYLIMGGIGSGGAREGSGRKAIDGARIKISVRVPEWLIKQIRSEAERRELTISQIITELITKGLER